MATSGSKTAAKAATAAPTPALANAASPTVRLAEIRTGIESIKQQLLATENTSADQLIAIERVDAYLDRLKAESTIPRAIESLTYPDSRTVELVPDWRTNERVEQLIAWLLPDLLRERLVAAVDAFYASNPAVESMTPADRAQQRERLTSALFEAEVEEERLIVRAEGVGIFLNRRIGANPAAILSA